MIEERDQTNLNSILEVGNLRSSYFFRDVVATGYATLTRGQEATVLAGVANRFTDLIKVSGSNTSTNAIAVDIRSGTGSGVIDTIVIPGTGVLGNMWHKYDVPLASSEQATAWTAQANSPDISDSPITITMVAVKSSRRI